MLNRVVIKIWIRNLEEKNVLKEWLEFWWLCIGYYLKLAKGKSFYKFFNIRNKINFLLFLKKYIIIRYF